MCIRNPLEIKDFELVWKIHLEILIIKVPKTPLKGREEQGTSQSTQGLLLAILRSLLARLQGPSSGKDGARHGHRQGKQLSLDTVSLVPRQRFLFEEKENILFFPFLAN